ncbi:serine/threonine-protein phosphatase [Pseudomonas fulva]|nr:PP2C family serine/threonine-protein phosphatase [Pseudomonas fulva]MBF8781412.1 serine/threonine-protein phosphatase [Pseudomonas fulva]
MVADSHWRSAGRTALGKVRTRNEDAYLERPERGLWAVADGMGGHQAGDLASLMVVEALAGLSLAGGFDEQVREVRQCLHWVDRRLGDALTVVSGRAAPIMGSTVVALLIHERRAACIWAGDSRCYLWRDRRLFQLTRDHSLRQRWIDERKFATEQARQQPGGHALTRALGSPQVLRLDVLEFRVMPSDTFLLCSDGLYHDQSDETFGKALDQAQPSRALDYLFGRTLLGKAPDNLTGVVIRQ